MRSSIGLCTNALLKAEEASEEEEEVDDFLTGPDLGYSESSAYPSGSRVGGSTSASPFLPCFMHVSNWFEN